MLTKDSFPLTHLYIFMLPNTKKHEKLFLHKAFHQNKQSVSVYSGMGFFFFFFRDNYNIRLIPLFKSFPL